MRLVFALWCALSVAHADPAAAAPAPAPAAQQVLLPLPRREIPAGTTLRARDFDWVWMPKDYVAQNVVVDPAPLVGAVTRERLLFAELVRTERLAPQPAGAPLVVADPPAQQAPRTDGRVMAVLFARNLAPGAALTAADLYAVEIPAAYLPEGTFLSPDGVVGRTLCEPVYSNEFVRAERLMDGVCPK